MTSWNSSEEEKISRIVDRLVTAHRQMTANHQQQQHSNISNPMAIDRAVDEQENAELRLMLNAISSKDVIGLVSLCGVFWSTRNQLRRELASVQKQRVTPQVLESLVEELLRRCGNRSSSSSSGSNLSAEEDALLAEHVNALRSQSYELLANYSIFLHQQHSQLFGRVYGGGGGAGFSTNHRIKYGEDVAPMTFHNSNAGNMTSDALNLSSASAVRERRDVVPAAGSLDDDTAMRLDSIRQFARSSLDADAARLAEIRQSIATITQSCASAFQGSSTRSAVDALARASAQADGRNNLKAAGTITNVPVSLPDGSVPWGLVRFVPAEAAPGQTILSVLQRCYGAEDLTDAEKDPSNIFSVNTGRSVVTIGRPTAPSHLHDSSGGVWASSSNSGCSSTMEPPVTSGATLESTFVRRANVLVRVFHRITGMTEALEHINARLDELKTALLPAAADAVNTAREELWATEVGRLQETSGGLVLNTEEAQNAAEALAAAKKKLAAAEHRVHKLEEAQRLSVAHKSALERANIGALSTMLESVVYELMTQPQDPDDEHSSKRLVYVCKELPAGHTIDTFAAAFGVPKKSLQVFEDHFADLSPVSKTRKRTVKTMVYIPTLVPRPSLAAIDEELRVEMDAYQRQFPSFPPNTEIAEQLVAVRQGDVATLSTMVSNARRRMQKFDETTEISSLKKQVVELQGALREQRARAEQLASSAKNLESELEAAHSGLAGEVETLRQRAADTQSKLEKAESALQAERLSRGTDASLKDREIAALRSQLQQLESQLTAMAQERQSLDERVNRFSAERDAAARRAQQLEVQAHGVEEILTEERHSTHSVALLNSQLKQQVATLQECLDVQNDEAARLRREIKRMSEVAAVAAEEHEQLRRELAEIKDAKATLLAQNQKLAGKVNSANANLASLRKEHQDTRETYIAKEIPSGRTAEEFAASLGVAADVSFPFYDASLGKHFLYYPIQTGRLSAADEDRRLRAELQALQSLGGGGSSSTVVLLLLDQLAALRSGDSVALSKMVSDLRSKSATAEAALAETQMQLRERVAELGALQQQQRFGHSPNRSATTTIDDESEDLSWFSPEVGKKKIILLREKIAGIERERDEWHQLCEEYQQRSAEFESLESAKADFLKRQAAHALLADTTSRELREVTERLRQSEQGRAKDLENFSANRRKLVAEQQAALKEMEELVDTMRKSAAADAQAARQQAQHDRNLIARLTAALREHGIVIETVDEE